AAVRLVGPNRTVGAERGTSVYGTSLGRLNRASIGRTQRLDDVVVDRRGGAVALGGKVPLLGFVLHLGGLADELLARMAQVIVEGLELVAPGVLEQVERPASAVVVAGLRLEPREGDNLVHANSCFHSKKQRTETTKLTTASDAS